jgi:molybdate transport system substrate-binding protein
VLYAAGRLVLFAPQGSPVGVDERLEGLRAAVSKGLVRRFAIANPQHAPYGRAAEEALRAAGLWEPLQSKLVLGENVAQAAQFSTTGAAQAGIFAYSLVLEPAIAKAGRHVLLPEKLHAPLRQRMALLKGAGEAARQFYAYLQSPATRERFRRHGFPMPDG